MAVGRGGAVLPGAAVAGFGRGCDRSDRGVVGRVQKPLRLRVARCAGDPIHQPDHLGAVLSGDPLDLLPMLLDQLFGYSLALVDDPLHLLIDEPGRLLAVPAGAGDLAAQEQVLVLIGKVERADGIAFYRR